ncbi:kynureninase [Idiomarina sp. A28L]|uniref:kynureninase n=1 Tax=Idiomarina sp. A28L TaxID=1036674 RepID=UPI0002138D47|nr:kynureninase [Idiomarina sp. A28L]EGN75504.1 kynureninase [Idiomarina sp. A28L]
MLTTQNSAKHSLDLSDPLAKLRNEFHIPADTIYLDGNSLGLLSHGVQERVARTLQQEWGNDVITSWNKHNWINLPLIVGDKIGRLIGAPAGHTVCCDSTSINLFKVLSAALQINHGRTEVLSTEDNFPTDLYMVQGLHKLLGERCTLRLVPENELLDSITSETAVVLATEVNFRTGRRLPLAELSQKAREQGALSIIDLAHSAGAMPVALLENHIDFAVGCTYKYMNAGPGAPAFLYVAPRHLEEHSKPLQPLFGWLGHAEPFAFSVDYAPAQGIRQFITGTPPILALAAVDAALDIFEGVDMADVRDKSVGLSKYWLERMAAEGLLEHMPSISPSDAAERGSQLAFEHEHAFAICQALIAEGVIADFRAPKYLRIGFSPLYNSYAEIEKAVAALAVIVHERHYQRAEFQQRGAVT